MCFNILITVETFSWLYSVSQLPVSAGSHTKPHPLYVTILHMLDILLDILTEHTGAYGVIMFSFKVTGFKIGAL